MQLREVLRETWRDVCSGASWAVTWSMVLGVLLTGIVGLRAATVAAEVRAAASYVASGATTMIQRSEGRIDGRACDALGASEGVVASGAVRRLEEGTVPAVLPGSAVPTYEVTGGTLAVLGVEGESGTSGVVVSRAVGDAIGVRSGDELVTAEGATVPVTGTYEYPDDGRDPDLEYALLAPTADDGRAYDACWVTVWPQRDDTVSMLRRTVLAATGAEGEDRPTVGQLNPRLGVEFVPSGGVPGPVSFGVAGLAGLVVGAAAVLRRRLVLASDLHIGVTRSAQVLGVVLGHVVWAGVAGCTALAVSTVLVRGLPWGDARPILFVAGAIVVVGVVSAVVGGGAAAVSIRERALHRYFRVR